MSQLPPCDHDECPPMRCEAGPSAPLRRLLATDRAAARWWQRAVARAAEEAWWQRATDPDAAYATNL